MEAKLMLHPAISLTSLLLAANAAAAPYPADLDPRFGDGGFVLPQLDPPGMPAPAYLAGIFHDANGGDVVVGGVSTGSNPGQFDIGITHLKANGALDTGFGNNGSVRVAQNFLESINAVARDSQGRIVIVGSSIPNSVGASHDFAIARLTPGGAWDLGFAYIPPIPPATTGSGGWNFAVFDLGGSGDDVPFALTVLPDDSIVVAGLVTTDGGYEVALARFGANGWLDNGFGNGGMAHFPWMWTSASGNWLSVARAIAPSHAGSSLVVAGSAYDAVRHNWNFAWTRYRMDGSGFVNTPVIRGASRNLGSFNNYAAAVVVGDDDTAYLGGTVCDGSCDMYVDAFAPDGSHPPQWPALGVYVGTTGAYMSDMKIVPGSGSGNDIQLLAAGYTGDDKGAAAQVSTLRAAAIPDFSAGGAAAIWDMPHANPASASSGSFRGIAFDHGRYVLGGTTLWCCSAPDEPYNDYDIVVARLQGDSIFYDGVEP
jgi:uncharacterized delta-60 repeat protein